MPVTDQLSPFVVSCDGGLLLDRSSFAIYPGAAFELQNYEPNIAGGYRRISGFEKYSTTALSGTGKILGLVTLGNSVIGARGANVEHGTGTTWTSITGARTNAKKYVFDKYNWTGTEVLIMADSVNPAATWDGSTYILMNGALGTGSGTAPTAPVTVQEHRNHIFYGQDHLLTFTAPFDANDFTPGAGAGQIVVPEGIVTIKSWRDVLFIFCSNSIYQLAGSSVDDFVLKPVTKNIGIRAKFSVQEIKGDLIYLAPDGLRNIAGTDKLDDTELGTISKTIQERLQGVTESTDDSEDISSLVIRNKTQYRTWFPQTAQSAASTTGLMAVFKRKFSTTTQIENPEETAGGWEFADLLGFKPSVAYSDFISGIETVFHGDFSNGLVYKQESSLDTFDGTNINARFRSPDLILGDIGIRKNIQRVILHLDNEGTTDSTLIVSYNFDDPDTPQPSSYSISNTAGGATYGALTSVYGTSAYNIPLLNIQRQSVEGSGFTVAIRINDTNGGNPYTIKGFQIEFVPDGRR